MSAITVIPVPCLRDNYAYVGFRADGDGRAFVVDPSEAEPVLAEVDRRGLTLAAILNTHHHADHVGGNHDLVRATERRSRPALEVFAHASDSHRVPCLTRTVSASDDFELLGIPFHVLHVPGHTLGAVTYVTSGHAFTGDTLFAAGIGRRFEGTVAQFFHSVDAVLGTLPDDTTLWTGHEYTAQNLRFAASIQPDHEPTTRRLAEVLDRRARLEPTAVTSMALERRTNPYLRTRDPALVRALGLSSEASPEEVFGVLRSRKDSF